MRFLKKDGTLDDKKILRYLSKAAVWYESGCILEAYQLLISLCSDIEEWMCSQEDL